MRYAIYEWGMSRMTSPSRLLNSPSNDLTVAADLPQLYMKMSRQMIMRYVIYRWGMSSSLSYIWIRRVKCISEACHTWHVPLTRYMPHAYARYRIPVPGATWFMNDMPHSYMTCLNIIWQKNISCHIWKNLFVRKKNIETCHIWVWIRRHLYITRGAVQALSVHYWVSSAAVFKGSFKMPEFCRACVERWGAGVETHFQEISWNLRPVVNGT